LAAPQQIALASVGMSPSRCGGNRPGHGGVSSRSRHAGFSIDDWYHERTHRWLTDTRATHGGFVAPGWRAINCRYSGVAFTAYVVWLTAGRSTHSPRRAVRPTGPLDDAGESRPPTPRLRDRLPRRGRFAPRGSLDCVRRARSRRLSQSGAGRLTHPRFTAGGRVGWPRSAGAWRRGAT
jgi:hypothetical protein